MKVSVTSELGTTFLAPGSRWQFVKKGAIVMRLSILPNLPRQKRQSQQLQSPGRRTVSAASAAPREITGTPTRDNVDMIKLTPVSVREDYNFVMTPEEGVADMF